jgi:hypothetical protein
VWKKHLNKAEVKWRPKDFQIRKAASEVVDVTVLTVIGPCIVILYIVIPTRFNNESNLFYFGMTLVL